MTYLYKVIPNTYVFEVHVPHNLKYEYRREYINDFRTDTRIYEPFIKFFSYEDYMSSILKPTLRAELSKHIIDGSIIGQLFLTNPMYHAKEDYEEKMRAAYMEMSINQPISLATVQLLTLGLQPRTNLRMRLFSDLISSIEELY